VTSGNPIEEIPADHTDPKTPDKGEPISPLTPTGTAPPIQSIPSPDGYQITCKTEKDWRDKVKFWAEILGLIALIFYTCQTCRTNDLTQSALTVSKQQFTESQRVSKEQFSDAQKASARQFDLDQRPWVGIVFAVQDFEKGKNPRYIAQYINTGRRPAKVIKSRAYTRSYRIFPRQPDYPEQPSNISSIAIIVPNATLTHTDPIPFPSDTELLELKKFPRQETLYIYASIDYEDVITHSSHWTHACWQYYPEYGGLSGSWVNCSVYNEVDEEKQ